MILRKTFAKLRIVPKIFFCELGPLNSNLAALCNVQRLAMAFVGAGGGVSVSKSISWPTAASPVAEAEDSAADAVRPWSASFNTSHLYVLTVSMSQYDAHAKSVFAYLSH